MGPWPLVRVIAVLTPGASIPSRGAITPLPRINAPSAYGIAVLALGVLVSFNTALVKRH